MTNVKCGALNLLTVKRRLATQRTDVAVATGGSGEASETPRH